MKTPCLAASIAVLLAAAAQADTFTWDGVTGDWNNPARWAPAGVPSVGDDAVIAVGGAYTVTAIGNIDINTLTFSAPGATLFLEARTANGTASLSFGGGLVNGNAIVLDSASTSASQGAALNVVTGTLENGVGKSIQILGNGAGKSRTVNADVNNAGSFTVGANALGLLTRGTGIFTNTGTVSVAGSGSLEFGSASVFNQNAGTLSVSGLFEMAADTFNFNGGTVTGNAPVLLNSTLNIGAGAGAGAFSFQGGSGDISGDVLAAHTIDLTAITTIGTATVAASNGFTNHGLIRMDSASTTGTHATNLIVASGTLTNAADGELRFAAGGAGQVRSTNLDLENNGLVTIVAGADARFTRGTGVTTNNATLSIGAGASLSFGSASVFNQNAGTLSNSGAFDMSADTFNFNGGALAGNAPVLLSSTLNIGVGSTGAGTFIMRGASGTLSGDIAPAQTVNLEATTGIGAATVSAAGSFTNHGNLVLDSTSTTASHAATFTVSAGTLTNAADGTVTLAGNGAGKNRTINADVANAGTFAIATDANGLLTRGTGIFTNTGIFTIAPSGSVAFGTASVFNQNGGTLTNSGAFDMSADTFNFNGGALAGNAPVLLSSTLNIGVGSTGAGTFIMRGASGTLSGDIALAQTVNLEATTGIGAATVSAAGSFAVHGTLRLDSTSTTGTHVPTFTVTTGTLAIGASGTLDAARNGGTSAARNLNANLDNDGLVTIHDGATLNLTKTSGVHFNDGTLHIGSGSKLDLLGSGTRTLTNRGVITGTGILDVDAVGANFINSGLIAPGASPGILTIEGGVTFDSDASLGIEIGGLIVGTGYDQLIVIGDLILSGDLFVTLLGGFLPDPGDTFTIIATSGAGNDITGSFDNTPGNHIFFPGGEADVTYTPSAVILSNVIIPEPASGLLLILVCLLANGFRGRRGPATDGAIAEASARTDD